MRYLALLCLAACAGTQPAPQHDPPRDRPSQPLSEDECLGREPRGRQACTGPLRNPGAISEPSDLWRKMREAYNLGDFCLALDLARRSYLLVGDPRIRYNLGKIHQQLGQLTEALADGESCARDAERDAHLNSREKIVEACRKLAEEMGGRVARIRVHVPQPPPPGLRVLVDGKELSPELYGKPYVVTPGEFEVAAFAPERLCWRRSVHAQEGQEISLDVE